MYILKFQTSFISSFQVFYSPQKMVTQPRYSFTNKSSIFNLKILKDAYVCHIKCIKSLDM